MLTSISEFKMLAAENVGKCLQQLSKSIDPTQTVPFNALINLQARLNRINNNKLANVLTEEEEARQENQLVMDVLEFLDSLSDVDFLPSAQLLQEIYEKILVVCYDIESEKAMRAFFDSFYFKNVQYTFDFNEAKIAWCDLVVFDFLNAQLNNTQYYELLQLYLDQTDKYLLYFGRFTNTLEYYPWKAHYAESPFELYARIREMIEFKKFYKGKS